MTTGANADSRCKPDLDSRIIAAEAALRHIMEIQDEIALIIRSVRLDDANYFLQAGFNESLVERSIGHLQEIFLFLDTTFPFDSPIFEQLGKVFSPFPGIVWMPERSQITPIFDSDGSVCDLDALFLSRTN